MFAIFKSGGKQYKVKAGDVVKLEKLEGEPGATINLENILMFGGVKTEIGAAASKGKLVAEILEQGKGEKIIIFKKKRRHNYRRKNGHRQLQTVVRITELTNPEGKTVKAEIRVAKAPRTEAEITASAQKASDIARGRTPKVATKKVVAEKKETKAKKPAAAKEKTTEKKPAAKKPAASKKKEI